MHQVTEKTQSILNNDALVTWPMVGLGACRIQSRLSQKRAASFHMVDFMDVEPHDDESLWLLELIQHNREALLGGWPLLTYDILVYNDTWSQVSFETQSSLQR